MQMKTLADGPLKIVKFGPLGAFANNAYIVADTSSKEAVIVDMPAESANVLTAVEEGGYRVKAILLTHGHQDHWADYKLVKETAQAPVLAHADEVGIPADKIDQRLADGQEISVGPFVLKAIHTPGHTPGHACYLIDQYLFSGDALFPGGPGRTGSPEALQQSIQSITSRLYHLPDGTDVLPGHGDDTTIGDSKKEYAVFESKEHPADLHGDVTWAGS
jgi:glyoxylase-like metal-dependent hydrolase (beta-lactamase superfamily II)